MPRDPFRPDQLNTPKDLSCPFCKVGPGRECMDPNNPFHNPAGTHRARTEKFKQQKTRELLKGGTS